MRMYKSLSRPTCHRNYYNHMDEISACALIPFLYRISMHEIYVYMTNETRKIKIRFFFSYLPYNIFSSDTNLLQNYRRAISISAIYLMVAQNLI